jgi:hypothetical protein
MTYYKITKYLCLTWKTGPTWFLNVATKVPFSPSHSFMLLSKLADSTQRPSGLNVTWCRRGSSSSSRQAGSLDVVMSQCWSTVPRGLPGVASSWADATATAAATAAREHKLIHSERLQPLYNGTCALTWFTSCTWPVMRAMWLLLVDAQTHLSLVKHSDPHIHTLSYLVK